METWASAKIWVMLSLEAAPPSQFLSSPGGRTVWTSTQLPAASAPAPGHSLLLGTWGEGNGGHFLQRDKTKLMLLSNCSCVSFWLTKSCFKKKKMKKIKKFLQNKWIPKGSKCKPERKTTNVLGEMFKTALSRGNFSNQGTNPRSHKGKA